MTATTLTLPASLPLEVDYQYYTGTPAQRERGGLAISPAEHSYVQINKVCIRNGDKLLDVTTLLSKQALEDIEDHILAQEEG